jgi:molybdopterin-guanine dinucleotide biosynthesis protein B
VPVLLLDPEPFPAAPAPAVIGIAGARGAGKTALIERLVSALARRGLRVAVVKHHAHLEVLDDPGTDTARAAAAGAVRTVLAGPGGAIVRSPAAREPSLDDAVAAAGPADLVLVEGYSQSAIPKILVRRAGVVSDRDPPRGPFLAVVGDAGMGVVPAPVVPSFAWDALDGLADLLERCCGSPGSTTSSR